MSKLGQALAEDPDYQDELNNHAEPDFGDEEQPSAVDHSVLELDKALTTLADKKNRDELRKYGTELKQYAKLLIDLAAFANQRPF